MNSDLESYQLIVLADETGKILAATQAFGVELTGAGSPTNFGIVPKAGQVLHNVTLPQGPERTAILESLDQFNVIIDGGQPTLVRR